MAKDKASRREAQERLAAERARQAAVERRRKLTFIAVISLILVAIVAVVGISIASQDSGGSAEGPTPAGATAENGGIATGPSAEKAAADGLPVVDIYSDYQCPACKTFELALGPSLETFAAEGTARVVYHGINLLGPGLSGTARTSSLRAAAAAGCASDAGRFLPFHSTAFAQQGTEGNGISDDQLVTWGKDAGIEGDALSTFEQCVSDETYVPWVKRVDAQSGSIGVTSTPTIFVNGKELTPDQRSSLEAFENAITSAKK